jgi:hypothetical protein
MSQATQIVLGTVGVAAVLTILVVFFMALS